MRNKFLLIALFVLAAVACGPKEEPHGADDPNAPALTVNKEQINVPAGGAEESFSITSNCYWNIAVTDADGKAVAWASLSATSGQGNKEIKVTVNKNTKTEQRTAVVTITVPSSSVFRCF